MAYLSYSAETHLADNLFLTYEYDKDDDGTHTALKFRLKFLPRDVRFTFDDGDSRYYKQIPKFLAGEKNSLELSYNSAFIDRVDDGFQLRFIGREGGAIEVALTKSEAYAVVHEIQKLQNPQPRL